MIDLTKIDTPFGDLDRETQWMLRGAHASGFPIEQADGMETSLQWYMAPKPSWSGCMFYRLKPKPVVETKSYRTGFSAYQFSEPLFSSGHKDHPDWLKVNVTVEWTDGKITNVKTELAQ